ncbi:unnamed protein product [Ilex paraguariensis]|uniref:Uncharacterized protein n=1 Tax=Ilex paraguariensis TaxID=185542 RepID=A0ABC8QKU5_9AQUA
MFLENLMEDKQLNFNQPLLSVRRVSSTVASEKDVKRKTRNPHCNIPPVPSYESELKSGPVTNPGVVPFIWEQTPGRPKDESKPQTHAIDRPPIVPKLPPGRILTAKQWHSDNVPEDERVTKHQGGKVPSGSQRVPSLDENVTKLESSTDIMEAKESSESGDDEETYLDARDTLSRTESFFLNCSVSGLSGYDGPDVKPSGTFSTDPQTRDFMMGRFLPAAKAMASETPQYAPRKPLVWEQPRQVKKLTTGNKPTQLRYGPNILPHYAQDNEEEESDDGYDDHAKLSAKVCGLVPRFCLKGSFGLLNQVPGMSVRTRVPMSPVSRTHPRSSSSGSYGETENEHTRVTIYEQRSVDGLETTVLLEDQNILKNESDQIAYQKNSQKLDGSSLYRRLQGSGLSPHCDELPQSPFLGVPREARNTAVSGLSSHNKDRNFRELLADRSINQETDSASPTVEKTLYVDIVHKVESPNLDLCSSHMKELPSLRENDFEILSNSKGMEETQSADSSVRDIENLTIVHEQSTTHPKFQKSADLLSSADKLDQEAVMELEVFKPAQDLCQVSITSENFKVPRSVNPDFEVQHPQKDDIFENSYGSYSEFPAPPPLPKSPSDSWLWRTLPSMSSKKLNQANKRLSVDPKWETTVKTTKVQNQHVRFSEVS